MAKKNNPDSMTWRNKCDVLIKKMFKGKPCAICGTINNTCGHHIITRKCIPLRHDLRNIIPLCPSHHGFNNDIAAHSSYAPAQEAFRQWIKDNDTDGWWCYKNYKSMKKTKTYQEIYEELSGMKW
jgi:hypothetical protein